MGAAAVAVAALAAGCAATPSEPTEQPPLFEGWFGEVREPSPPPTAPAPTPDGDPTFRPTSTTASVGGCAMYPREHYMNAVGVERLPVHPSSSRWIATMGGSATTMRFPTSRVWDGARAGVPINVVDSRATGFRRVLLTQYSKHAHTGGYPIPESPRVQGYPTAQWDKHLLILDSATCTAYELIQYDPFLIALTGIEVAMSGTKYRLDTVEPPPMTTNAPNTPMLGQYVMVDEVRSGEVPHVMSFCSDTISGDSVWPARMSDGRAGDAAMPMGTWIRLGDHVDAGSFPPGAAAVVRALRTRGAVLTDSCAHRFSLLAENSAAWDDEDMQQLRTLTAADFEVVDTAPMRHDPAVFDYRIR